MSSSNWGYEDGDDDEILLYPPLPPHLESPSTSFLGYMQQDLSLLFVDNYAQNNPNPLLGDSFIITHQTIDQLGQGQPNGKGDQRATSSSSLSRMMKQKKMDHNEKERVRRLHLNTAYLALRSLLPDQSHKPKKKWSAPYLIDRAVDHIPQIESELEKLKSKKKDLLLELEKVHDLKQAEEAEKQDKKPLSISINEVRRGEVIIQICHQINKVDIFSNLLDKLESEGMVVFDASVLDPSEDTSCHHIHIQMDESSMGDDYVAGLKEKLSTWLS